MGEEPPPSARREESLWERVLAEHRANSCAAKDRDEFRVFLLGSKFDEKQKLVKQLLGHQEEEEESEEIAVHGLGFTFCEWKERPIGDDEETRVRLQLTTVEKPSMQHLLPAYFLGGGQGKRSLESAVFIIFVDLSQPHDAMERLNGWYAVVEKQVKELCADDPDLQQRMQEKVERECDLFHNDPRAAVKKKAVVDDDLEVIGSPTSPTDGRSMQTYRKMGIFRAGNLGVPLVVVGTRSDVLDKVAASNTKEPKDKQHYLNYLQGALRKWCIERAAALMYTSGDRASTDMLKEYLLYRLANIPMSTMLDDRRQVVKRVPPVVLDNRKLFVPAFADSLPQVTKLEVGRYADSKFELVMCPPEKKEEAKEDIPEPFGKWLTAEKKKGGEEPSLLGPSRVPPYRPSNDKKDLVHKANKFFHSIMENLQSKDMEKNKAKSATAQRINRALKNAPAASSTQPKSPT